MCARHTDRRDARMARKPPVRTTRSVHLTLPQDADERLRSLAARLGYTESEYVATLVRGQTPIARPGAEMQDVALAGNRVVRAIGMLENGPDDRPEIVRLLREAQAAIAAELRRATSNYEQAIATQVADDTWGDA